jgi:Tripartite tricarboxylate transporter TctB family
MRWRSLRLADLVAAGILCLLGLAVLIGVSQMRVGFAAQFQPRLFPSLVGWLLIVVGGGLGLAALRTPAQVNVEWPTRHGAIRVAIMLASVAGYVLSIGLLGMLISTFLVVSFEVWYLGNYRWHVPIAAGLVSAAVLYLVFMHALGLTFPAGPFETLME